MPVAVLGTILLTPHLAVVWTVLSQEILLLTLLRLSLGPALCALQPW